MARFIASPRRSRTRQGMLVAASAAFAAGLAFLPASAYASTGSSGGASQHTSHGSAESTSSVPKHALTGYWQNFDNGATVQTLDDVSDQYDIVAVAFADTVQGNPGAVDFTLDKDLNYSAKDFKADIAKKHDEGKKVILSVGGEKGSVSVSDSESATNFADSVYAQMQEYDFDGVDIDLENGLNATYMTQALKSLSDKAGSDLVITMAPQTVDMQSPSDSYFKTALNISDILTVVNMQYYNSGSMKGCDGKVHAQGDVDFLTSLACIQLENGLAPEQVGIGVPASPSAAGSGYVEPAVVNDALDCLAAGEHCGSFTPETTYPGIRGAMAWSTNWDADNGGGFANTVGPHLDELP